ncbi:DUF6261 family protein [Phocaeicola sp.]
MQLLALKNQNRLKLGEFYEFLKVFLDIFETYSAQNLVIKSDDDNNVDIDLFNKQIKLHSSLIAFNEALGRPTKAEESKEMAELDKLRYQKLKALFALIESYLIDNDIEKRKAAENYKRSIDKLKGIGACTNSEQSGMIDTFVNAIQNETNKKAFALLKLEERAKDAKEANDKYMELEQNRNKAAQNRSASSTNCRNQCVQDYRHLVSLINSAQELNSTLLYDDMINELTAKTTPVQQLINRRTNIANAKKRGEFYDEEDMKELKMEDDMVEMENNMDNEKMMEA